MAPSNIILIFLLNRLLNGLSVYAFSSLTTLVPLGSPSSDMEESSLRSRQLGSIPAKSSTSLSYESLSSKTLNRPTQDFTLERNVTVRQVSWLGKCVGDGRQDRHENNSMLPLQKYRGAAVGPKVRAKKHIEKMMTSEEDNCSIENMSRSAQTLLEKYTDLSDRQKSQLENKIQAEARASEPLDPLTDLHILYLDEHICVTNKPSGILSVPGPRRNPSLAGLVYDMIQPPAIDLDQMVVHRLDMDTSGIIVYALTEHALKQLHIDFRERRVQKVYEALLAGHLSWSAQEVEIDVDLERDPFHPPFMRAAQPKSDAQTNTNATHPTFQKFIDQAPKPSQTELYVLSREFLPGGGLPVTRVRLTPKTGRTHQLRVHCASLGFPIVGDDIYGLNGAGDCGIALDDDSKATERLNVQRQIYEQGLPLCLHAKQLCFNHPFSRAPLIFETVAPF